MAKCKQHNAYARCVCGADFNIPKGYVLVKEHDLTLLNAATGWAAENGWISLPGGQS